MVAETRPVGPVVGVDRRVALGGRGIRPPEEFLARGQLGRFNTGVRDGLRQRVKRIPGVDIPLSRLERRPSFPTDRLAADEGLTAAIDTHTWLVDRRQLGIETE